MREEMLRLVESAKVCGDALQEMWDSMTWEQVVELSKEDK